MKLFLLLLATNLIAIFCLYITFWMIQNDKSGWGWMLLAALICSYGVQTKYNTDESE